MALPIPRLAPVTMATRPDDLFSAAELAVAAERQYGLVFHRSSMAAEAFEGTITDLYMPKKA